MSEWVVRKSPEIYAQESSRFERSSLAECDRCFSFITEWRHRPTKRNGRNYPSQSDNKTASASFADEAVTQLGIRWWASLRHKPQDAFHWSGAERGGTFVPPAWISKPTNKPLTNTEQYQLLVVMFVSLFSQSGKLYMQINYMFKQWDTQIWS